MSRKKRWLRKKFVDLAIDSYGRLLEALKQAKSNAHDTEAEAREEQGRIVIEPVRRSALVPNLPAYNGKTDPMICCPLTTQIKNYPFEVFIGGTGRRNDSPERLAEVRAKI